MRKNGVFVFFVLGCMVFQPVFSAHAEFNMLGQVASAGAAEVRQKDGSWQKAGRMGPVFQESEFRTQKGRFSFFLKEGVRLEAGDNTHLAVRGSAGDFALDMKGGKVAFNVGRDERLLITTPDVTVSVNRGIRRLSALSGNEEGTSGGVYFDGSGTRVVAVSGEVSVMTLSGEAIMALSAGEGVTVALGEKGYKTFPVQAFEEAGSEAFSWFWMLAGGVAAAAAGGALYWEMENGGGGDGPSASPAVP